jgi:hypothetical protein
MRVQEELYLFIGVDAQLARDLTELLAGRARIRQRPRYEPLPAELRASVRALVIDGAALPVEARGSAREQNEDAVSALSSLRDAHPLAHLLLIATPAQLGLINALQPLRVAVALRPVPQVALRQFVERSLSAGRLPEQGVESWLRELARGRRLTARDLALMPLVLEAETPEAACARLGVDSPTLGRAVRRLLKKCRMRSADRLAASLMRGALLFRSQEAVHAIGPIAGRLAS